MESCVPVLELGEVDLGHCIATYDTSFREVFLVEGSAKVCTSSNWPPKCLERLAKQSGGGS